MSKLPAGRVRTCCQRLAVAQQTRPQPGRADCSRRGGRNLRDGASRPCGAPLPAGPQYPGEADGNCEGRMLRHARYEFLYHLSWRDATDPEVIVSRTGRALSQPKWLSGVLSNTSAVTRGVGAHVIAQAPRSRYCSGPGLFLFYVVSSFLASVTRPGRLLGR